MYSRMNPSHLFLGYMSLVFSLRLEVLGTEERVRQQRWTLPGPYTRRQGLNAPLLFLRAL